MYHSLQHIDRQKRGNIYATSLIRLCDHTVAPLVFIKTILLFLISIQSEPAI